MGIFKKLTAVVALVAITIGTVKQLKPELFFMVPEVGFILWAITGGTMPPYFSTDAWQPAEMRTWIKDNDLVVATGAKSGTTWMLFCTHQIRTKGSDEIDFRDVSISTPWPVGAPRGSLHEGRSTGGRSTRAAPRGVAPRGPLHGGGRRSFLY